MSLMKKVIIAAMILAALGAGALILVAVNKKGQSNLVSTNMIQNTKTIAIDEVAKHTASSDCWTAISGNVYNITDFIPNHPGGAMIASACGIDATNIFNGQGHSGRAMNTLDQYQIGVLAK